MPNAYRMNESELQAAIHARYHAKVGNGIVGGSIAETVIDDSHRNPIKSNPNGYFSRLADMANQVGSERIARDAIKKGLDPVDLLKLAKLEMIFSKRHNRDTVSAIEYQAVLDEFKRRFGSKPDMNQVRKMMKEHKSNRIKCLEKLL